MSRYKHEEFEKAAATTAAMLIAASARTAPKARGIDDMTSLIIDGEDLEKLAVAMETKAEKKADHLAAAFRRDAKNVRSSRCVLLLGVKGDPKDLAKPMDCGACGYETCGNMMKANKRGNDFKGPFCMFQLVDLGVALGSAVKLAGELGMDNRMMYTVGATAMEMDFMNADIIIGIPLSVSGKSPYFDR